MDPWPPNLDWITDRLAVGGGVESALAERLASELGISAVVDLRAEAGHDAETLRRHGVSLLHLPTEDHCAVAQAALDEGVAFVGAALAAGGRALVHCREGVGRSALLALCILVDQGAAPLEALTLAKDRRWQVSPSPAQYEAWAAWLRRRGLAPPDFDAFRQVAYRHLAGA
jgi:protein-tyrosine phosphatase